MIEIVCERTIAAAPVELWRVIEDPERLPEWFSFAERAEVLEGGGMGRRQRIHGHWGKKRSEVDQRVVAYVPERLLAWTHEAERVDGKPAPLFAESTEVTVRLNPAGDATQVRLESRQVPAGRLKGIALRLFGARAVGDHLNDSLERLDHMFSTPEP
ncbi:MAG: SRPBCC domain-containing protein [Actinomycetota bacterium]